MKEITWKKAAKYTRRHVYYRRHNGELAEVRLVQKWAAHCIRIELVNGREVVVDDRTRLYVRGGS